MKTTKAEVLREYGPFAESERVHGVTFDGERVWFATGTHLQALDPESGKLERSLPVASDAGTAFDGKHFYQLTGGVIQTIDAQTGSVLRTIPSPGQGRDSGLAWAEGALWVGQYRDRKIHRIDPLTGRILKTLDSDRFVTGITWVDGELWHGTLEDDASELRRIDADSGEVLDRLAMPADQVISGLECDGRETFFCGGASSGKVRAVRRPRR